MPTRKRLLLEASVIAFTGALTAFLLLTLLHAALPRLASLDAGLQSMVHGWTSPMLTWWMEGFSLVGSIRVFIPTLLLALTFFVLQGQRQAAVQKTRKRHTSALFGFAIGGALVLNETFKIHFHRARPSVPWSIGDEHTFSFPSGHSLFSCVLYGLIGYLVLARRTPLARRATVAAFAFAMPLCIGISRIYLGEHYPTDVLAGYLTGATWLGATIALDRRWRAHTVRTAKSSVLRKTLN